MTPLKFRPRPAAAALTALLALGSCAAQAQSILDTLASNVRADVVPTRKAFEATNMLTIASAVVAAARTRTESRGCHRRTDVDDPSDEWLRHLTATLHNGHMEVA